MDTTVVGSFRYRHEAEMARAYLEMEGIEAMVAGDDAGGMEPGIMSPARVIVRAEDAERAREILERQNESGDE